MTFLELGWIFFVISQLYWLLEFLNQLPDQPSRELILRNKSRNSTEYNTDTGTV